MCSCRQVCSEQYTTAEVVRCLKGHLSEEAADAFGGRGVNGAELSPRGKISEVQVARMDLCKCMSVSSFFITHTIEPAAGQLGTAHSQGQHASF